MTDQLPGGYRVQALPDGCRNCRHADWTESNCQDSVEVGACTVGRRGLGINESYEAWAAHSRDYLEGRTVHPAGICDKYEKGRR